MGWAIKNFTATTPAGRGEVFITTKIPSSRSAAEAEANIRYNLGQLMVEYVDLLLIHTPSPNASQNAVTWAAMQSALRQNLTRAIGLSNFNQDQIEALLDATSTSITPAVNQCLLHVGVHNDNEIAFCKSKGITYQSYSALGHPNGGGQAVYDLPVVTKIAAKRNLTGAQVGLRWLVQSGHPFVTASGQVQYDREDLDLFSFELTSDEMSALTAFRE